MRHPEIRQAIDDYLNLIENGAGSVSENEATLVAVLDRLALVQSIVVFDYDEDGYPKTSNGAYDYPNAPSRDYKELRRIVSDRFPEYGHYNIPESVITEVGESECIVADAIDDLADIANDLYKVTWHWSNTSEERALWEFQFYYKVHWRAHLRGLQLYLDALELHRELND